jgi:hypothetical protein
MFMDLMNYLLRHRIIFVCGYVDDKVGGQGSRVTEQQHHMVCPQLKRIWTMLPMGRASALG